MGSKASLKANFHVTYNGIHDSSIGVHVATRPEIPSTRESLTAYTIPGRDGQLIIKDGTLEDISIPVSFSFSAYPDDWQDRVSAVKSWLQMKSGATLKFSDLPNMHYKVRYVELSGFSRQYRKVGVFMATFVCEGCQYYDSGLTETNPGTLSNPGIVSHPVYKITASSSGTATLTVNGKTLTATVASNLTIDTERMAAYRTTDGVALNTALIMGNLEYKDFWLNPGSNSVSISSGYTLKIIPNWRRL